MVGLDSPDDGGVIDIGNGIRVVQTVDFFTPILDNPFDWGKVAAANALSDIYAMGGTPISSLQLVSWPREDLSFEILSEVCLLYTSPSPRDLSTSRMPSSA